MSIFYTYYLFFPFKIIFVFGAFCLLAFSNAQGFKARGFEARGYLPPTKNCQILGKGSLDLTRPSKACQKTASVWDQIGVYSMYISLFRIFFRLKPCPFGSGLRKFALDLVVVIFFKNAEKVVVWSCT